MSFEPDAHQQALLEAVWASHQYRITPGTAEAQVVTALATCKPSLLRLAGLPNAVHAWASLTEAAREVVNHWWLLPPKPPEAWFGETCAASSPDELTRVLHDPASLRLSRGEAQNVFWPRFGVSQSGGARYEGGRRLAPPVRLLLALFASGQLMDGQLRYLKGIAASRKPKPTAAERAIIDRLAHPARARTERGETQQLFWERFGATQAHGSRYENGRALPRPTAMLLAGFV